MAVVKQQYILYSRTKKKVQSRDMLMIAHKKLLWTKKEKDLHMQNINNIVNLDDINMYAREKICRSVITYTPA